MSGTQPIGARDGHELDLPSLSHASMWREIEAIAARASHVAVDDDALRRLAALLRTSPSTQATPFWRDPIRHPRVMPEVNDESAIQFIGVFMAMCFVIWQRHPDGTVGAWSCTVEGQRLWGAEAIAACHMRALRRGVNILDPNVLSTLDRSAVEELFRDEASGASDLQLLDVRREKYRELGRVLLKLYDGSFANLLRSADGRLFRDDGGGVVQRLIRGFPLSFGDWPFAKLPMVTVKTLYERRGAAVTSSAEYELLTRFRDLDRLEGAADYYIPFFFYRFGVLRIDAGLHDALVERRVIPDGSDEERELRALTMCALRDLRRRTELDMAQLDSLCWLAGATGCRPCHPGVSEEEVPCAFRSDCRAYQREPALMAAAWPLVQTSKY